MKVLIRSMLDPWPHLTAALSCASLVVVCALLPVTASPTEAQQLDSLVTEGWAIYAPETEAVERGRAGVQRTASEYARVFYAQSVALLTYLLETSGPRFVGVLADGLAEGRPVVQVLADAPGLPEPLDEIEAAFLAWLAER